MSGCSLQEAFPDPAKQAGQIARKEEKRKAEKCRGPALAFLKSSGEVGGSTPEDPVPGSPGLGGYSKKGRQAELDPDRQHLNPLPPAETLKGREGFEETMNSKFRPVAISATEQEERDLVKDLVGQRVDDVIGQTQRRTFPRATATSAAQLPNFRQTIYGEKVPDYFGRSEADEQFADFSASLQDNPGYQLQPADFLASFGAVGLGKAQGQPYLATPSVNDAWKPLTPTGARTSFFEHLPAPGGQQPVSGPSGSDREELVKKIDTLFARLDDLESRDNANAHIEVSLFILSGLFLMFGLETVRKLG